MANQYNFMLKTHITVIKQAGELYFMTKFLLNLRV